MTDKEVSEMTKPQNATKRKGTWIRSKSCEHVFHGHDGSLMNSKAMSVFYREVMGKLKTTSSRRELPRVSFFTLGLIASAIYRTTYTCATTGESSLECHPEGRK